MYRYRMMYAKEGPAKYISHLDLIRAFERAARRAGLPVAFTQGFNPHPKLSFAAPLAVGTSGEAEFADIELTENIPAGVVAKSLSEVMPEGLRLIEVRMVAESAPALMAIVDRAAYTARAVLETYPEKEALAGAVADFWAKPEVLVERRSKTGDKRKYDIKPGILAMSARINNDIIEIEAELKTGSNGNIRCEELIAAFMAESGLKARGNFVLRRRALYAAGQSEREMLW
ncbi:TIGR03936 family radical SAM-associated protein [Pelotomaculum propionicicum]|uniref:TIGR03936 family radical SAM-associated protein n=1 Tax=Pelotomaculum propionicicum TaxID=258475 RepID=UPI003B80967E